MIEGVVEEARVHSMFLRKMRADADQADSLPGRYAVVVMKSPRSFERVFVSRRGHEEELDYTQNAGLPDGHRNKHTVPEQDAAALLKAIGGCPLPSAKMLPARLDALHPRQAGVFEFWIDIEKPGAKSLDAGKQLRLLTLGNSILVDRFELMSGVNLFKNADNGTELSSGWIGNVQKFSEPHITEDSREGVDDDEWDD